VGDIRLKRPPPNTIAPSIRDNQPVAQHQIRCAGPGDAREVARLLHDFNTEYEEFTPGVNAIAVRAREVIEKDEMVALLGGEGPDALAVIRLRPSLWSDSLDAYLEELYVAPAERGHGLGRALLEEAMDAARAAGSLYIGLATSEDDTAAMALYESCGFVNREKPPDGPVMYFYERDL
jgi:ribosomal protein S18 acetylase RimI-like enzyme